MVLRRGEEEGEYRGQLTGGLHIRTMSLVPMDCSMGLVRKGELREGGKSTSRACGPNSTAASTEPLQSELQRHCTVVILTRGAVFAEATRPPGKGR